MKFSYLLSKDMFVETSKHIITIAVLVVFLPIAVVVAEPIDGTDATQAFNSDLAFVASDDSLDSGITVKAVITAYNPVAGQTDSTPNIMANGQRVYEGAVACPRKYKFGTQVKIDGKFYTCGDRMNIRYENRPYEHFDKLLFSYTEAKNYGRQTKEVTVYPA